MKKTKYFKGLTGIFTVIFLLLAGFSALISCKTEIDGLENSATLASIQITQEPAKTSYYLTETFDPAGLVVTAVYSDDTSEPVTGFSLSVPDTDTLGTKSVVVTYEKKTASFDITVSIMYGDAEIIIY